MIAQNMGTKIGLMEHIYFVILGAGYLTEVTYNKDEKILYIFTWVLQDLEIF